MSERKPNSFYAALARQQELEGVGTAALVRLLAFIDPTKTDDSYVGYAAARGAAQVLLSLHDPERFLFSANAVRPLDPETLDDCLMVLRMFQSLQKPIDTYVPEPPTFWDRLAKHYHVKDHINCGARSVVPGRSPRHVEFKLR